MVVFTCQHCGDPVNKPKVEKHYQTKCRYKPPVLTCVDCLKDFNEDFSTHTQCVTEDQRYSAKGTVFKEPAGRSKQAQYVQMIQDLLNSKNLTVVQRKLLQICSEKENVPRKLIKFQNFMNNVARGVKCTDVDIKSVFTIIENTWKKENPTLQAQDKNSIGADDLLKTGKVDETVSVEHEDTGNENCEPKKDKKTKHNKVSESLSAEVETQIENGTEAQDLKNLNGISKKELKKQKKREKYLIKLKNMEIDKIGESVEESFEDACTKKKKSSKKSKKEKTREKVHNVNGESNEVSVDIINSETIETDDKKTKKRKLHNDSTCEGVIVHKKKKAVKHEVLEEQDQNHQPVTFDWAQTIITVLEGRSEKELSLKRLGKKVIGEYQMIKQDHRTYEELLAKFNKKVKKTVGVRVLKDKAKLIE